MIATETARLVVLGLMALCVIWIILVIVKKDHATLPRAIIISVLVGLALLYVHQTKLETLTLKSIKEDLFPPKQQFYRFEKRESSSGGIYRTVFVFAEPGPRLNLSMESGGKYLAIRKVDPLNRVLAYVGLPPVKEGVMELAGVTGRAIDANIFRWDKYELGVLTIERGICHDAANVESFPCIATITVTSR